jgi:hypothetical protein
MAATPVGTKVAYHSEHGDTVAWVVEYQEGRPAGDYYVAGWTTPAAQKAGAAAYFGEWAVYGGETGAFTPF